MRGRDDHHISVRVWRCFGATAMARNGGAFFLQPTAGNKIRIEKKKRKDPSGWTTISSWFDIKGFGVVSFGGQDFSLGSELHGSFFHIPFSYVLTSQQGKLRVFVTFFLLFSLGTYLLGVCISILSGGVWERDGERAIPDGFLIVGSYSLKISLLVMSFYPALFPDEFELIAATFPFSNYWVIG